MSTSKKDSALAVKHVRIPSLITGHFEKFLSSTNPNSENYTNDTQANFNCVIKNTFYSKKIQFTSQSGLPTFANNLLVQSRIN